MGDNFERLRQGKHLSSEELQTLIESLTPQFADRISGLRRLLDRGQLFALRRGEASDSKVIQSVLLSMVLADVSVLNPFAKAQQTDTIGRVCENLGVSYEDVLRLTVEQAELAEVLTGER